MDQYGTRLYGYSEKNKNGIKLYRFSRGSSGEDYEHLLGVIKTRDRIYHGPVVIQTWELQNGEKYYHV